MSPPRVDVMVEDYTHWKNAGGYNDGIPPICAAVMDAINGAIQFAFQAGWEYRDQRDATVGKKASKKIRQQEGRTGLGNKNGRHNATEQRQELAPKTRRKKRRVSG